MYVTDVPVIDRLIGRHAERVNVTLEALEEAIWNTDGGCGCNDCQPYVFPQEAYGALRDAITALSEAYLNR